MRTSPLHHIHRHRKTYHLNLKDVAFLLDMDPGNLSRFEAGKSQNPKALLGYHYLFNLSIDKSLFHIFNFQSEEIVHRCFRLLEILQNKSKTKKNMLRIKGINSIINKLTPPKEDETRD